MKNYRFKILTVLLFVCLIHACKNKTTYEASPQLSDNVEESAARLEKMTSEPILAAIDFSSRFPQSPKLTISNLNNSDTIEYRSGEVLPIELNISELNRITNVCMIGSNVTNLSLKNEKLVQLMPNPNSEKNYKSYLKFDLEFSDLSTRVVVFPVKIISNDGYTNDNNLYQLFETDLKNNQQVTLEPNKQVILIDTNCNVNYNYDIKYSNPSLADIISFDSKNRILSISTKNENKFDFEYNLTVEIRDTAKKELYTPSFNIYCLETVDPEYSLTSFFPGVKLSINERLTPSDVAINNELKNVQSTIEKIEKDKIPTPGERSEFKQININAINNRIETLQPLIDAQCYPYETAVREKKTLPSIDYLRNINNTYRPDFYILIYDWTPNEKDTKEIANVNYIFFKKINEKNFSEGLINKNSIEVKLNYCYFFGSYYLNKAAAEICANNSLENLNKIECLKLWTTGVSFNDLETRIKNIDSYIEYDKLKKQYDRYIFLKSKINHYDSLANYKQSLQTLYSFSNQYQVAKNALKDFDYKKAEDITSLIVDSINSLRPIKSLNKNIEKEFDNIYDEAVSLKQKAIANLDIYGNPPGWVPMVSYEFNKAAFNQELDYALNAIYLDYIFNKAENSLSNEHDNLDKAKGSLLQENTDLEKEISNYSIIIEDENSKLEFINRSIKDDTLHIKDLRKKFRKKAIANVHRRKVCNIISSVTRVAGSIAMVVPGGQIVAAGCFAVSALANTIGEMDFDDPVSRQNLDGFANNLDGFVADYKNVKENGKGRIKKDTSSTIKKDTNLVVKKDTSAVKKDTSEIKWNHPKLDRSVEIVGVAAESLHGVSNCWDAIATMNDDSEIEQELQKLLDKNKDYLNTYEDFQKKSSQVVESSDIIHKNTLKLKDCTNQLSRNQDLVDILTKSLAEIDNVVKMNATEKLMLANHRSSSLDRLFKYYYLMAKAYEYRVMETFPADNINLDHFYDNIDALFSRAGMKMDKDFIESTKILYSDAIMNINSQIINKVNSGEYYLTTEHVYYSLTKDEIEKINNKQAFTLNFYKKAGLFPLDEENLRIDDITIEACKFKDNSEIHKGKSQIETNVERESEFIKINFIHSGISMLRKNGEIKLFNHYNSKPSWKNHIDLIGKTIQREPIAKDFVSLLLDATGKSVMGDLSVFSLPSVNSDLSIVPHFNSEKKFEKIVLKIEYNKQELKDDRKLLRVYSNIGNIDNYYYISEADINGKQHAYDDNFQRCYAKNSNINISTFRQLQNHTFVRWEQYIDGKWKPIEQSGTDAPNSLKIKLDDHVTVRAYYEENEDADKGILSNLLSL